VPGGAEAPRLDQRTRAAREQAREARDELLAAALRVFASRGYRQAGVDEIAAAAGYSKGALYWHFSGKEDLLLTRLEERVDVRTREMLALLESGPPERDMSVEASREFARRLSSRRDAVLLEREYWSLAIRDPELRARYAERQTELRGALATAMEARARHLGTPHLTMPAQDVARIVMSIIGGLAVDELIEPGSVRPELLGEALAAQRGGPASGATRRTATPAHRAGCRAHAAGSSLSPLRPPAHRLSASCHCGASGCTRRGPRERPAAPHRCVPRRRQERRPGSPRSHRRSAAPQRASPARGTGDQSARANGRR